MFQELCLWRDGVLIAIMVAGFMMFVLRKAGRMSLEYDMQKSDLEVVNFNSQFEYYAKEDNTFFDIITVSNMAYDVNKKNGYDAQNSVEIRIMNENNSKVLYSILLSKNLTRNYFFEGDDVNSKPQYMYDLVSDYAETKPDSTDFVYSFRCTNTSYHNVTGKVTGMTFQIKRNS